MDISDCFWLFYASKYNVLIVLYGIETTIWKRDGILTSVLIVLYGIETFFVTGISEVISMPVLIVLYGIETYMKFQLESFFYRLNRTLWN